MATQPTGRVRARATRVCLSLTMALVVVACQPAPAPPAPTSPPTSGTPLVDAQARFLATATYGDRIEVETSIVEWRNTSFVMRHVIRCGATVVAEGREVRIFAQRHPEDRQRLKAVPPPADIRRRFQ